MKIKSFVGICLVLYFVISFSCLKKPQWQTNVTIPLISKYYSVQSLIDTNYLRINNDSSIRFFVSGKLDTFSLLDSINIHDRSDTSETKIFDFVFNNLASGTVGITPDEIIGIPLPDTTIHIIIPSFNRNIDKTLRINNIGTASIRSGFLQITIINNSRLTFDSVNCYLPNLEVIHVNDIDSLSTAEFSRHLYNVSIESITSFNIFFASSGTGTDSIPISRHDSIKFIVTFDSLRIDFGCFHSVPPRLVRTVKNRIYSLPSNYKIKISDLIFHTGQLSIKFDNQFPLSTVLQCSIPELSFDTVLQLTAYNSINFTINLQNQQYHNASDSLTPLTLRTIIEFQLDSLFISLGPENSITISYLINNIQIDSIAGTIIDTIQHQFAVDSIPISLPNFLQRVKAVHVAAVLDFTNAVAFPINLRLHASAISSSDSASIDTMFPIATGTPTNPYIGTLTVDFTRLFNIHPTNIELNIEMSSIGTGWMSRASYNTASYIVTSPLRVVLRADTITFNPSNIRISQKIRNVVRDYGDSSVFFAHIQNHIPARMSGDVILENLVFDTVRVGITVPSGIIDPYSGLVNTPVDTNIVVSLDSLATKIFTDSVIKVSVILYIPDTDTITISARDYFKLVNSYARVQTKMIPK